MKVVLVKDVPNVGRTGDLVDVANGLARNMLLPRGLAVPASPAALAQAEARVKRKEKEQRQAQKAAKDLGKQLGAAALTMRVRVNDQGEPYAGVGVSAILEAASAAGLIIAKEQLALTGPIKKLGPADVPVKLGGGKVASLHITIIPA
ncbi:50S ribosomal protein L9 [Patescibacteria group bacterium]|nr:MAG: 50S ribosomal protein L9 [Patescibacteria group bacterium]